MLVTRFLDLLLPRRCCVCAVELGAGTGGDSSFFCAACLGELAGGVAKRCGRCSAPLGPGDAHENGCPACQTTQLRFRRSYAAGSYDGLMRELLLGLKFRRRSDFAEPLADLLFRGLPDGEAGPRVDVVVPVPTNGSSTVSPLAEYILIKR